MAPLPQSIVKQETGQEALKYAQASAPGPYFISSWTLLVLGMLVFAALIAVCLWLLAGFVSRTKPESPGKFFWVILQNEGSKEPKLGTGESMGNSMGNDIKASLPEGNACSTDQEVVLEDLNPRDLQIPASSGGQLPRPSDPERTSSSESSGYNSGYNTTQILPGSRIILYDPIRNSYGSSDISTGIPSSPTSSTDHTRFSVFIGLDPSIVREDYLPSIAAPARARVYPYSRRNSDYIRLSSGSFESIEYESLIPRLEDRMEVPAPTKLRSRG
ncbi:hypothetical protein TWF718_000287 [Orbilia javanica]|uniref:Uncharacterized protein n=1 Tax=Orbilia javanica TaxID=47235 RepID=A0AAN8MZF9_9PEZI